MTLDDFLRDNKITAAAFALRLNISEASLSRIRRGEQNISRETIRQIVEETRGAVSAAALVFSDVHSAQVGRDGDHRTHDGTSAIDDDPGGAIEACWSGWEVGHPIADGADRVVLCASCERRLDDPVTRSCTMADCPRRLAMAA